MWIPFVMISVLGLLVFGIVNGGWKFVFASVWVPLAAMFLWLLGALLYMLFLLLGMTLLIVLLEFASK